MSRLHDRWSDIDPILNAALDMAPRDRAGYIARACGDDPELRDLVVRLLAQSTGDTPPVGEGPLWDALAEDLAAGATPPATPGEIAATPPLPVQGTVIDRYRLLEEIGRGGMSVVFKAERVDGTFDAPVALKLATLGGLDAAARARFERERRILAELRHPNIAQILDGGESESGQLYFVMELVDGEPIDTYADRLHLDVDARLALFADVARAVQHAHRNLVVHRDIKPSNVLVDRDGRVKLLDFGIAALLDETDVSITHTHLRPMTPAFASPEQLRGEVVTTVSDVYQLGNLLYRLLTGCPPYRPDTQDTDAWRRAITETEPARPSLVVAQDAVRERLAPEGVAIGQIARQRGTTPAGLARRLRGDVETIVLTALRKEPDRRYASALQLAEDIDRYREGLPVSAQPDTAGYRLRKFVARNRAGVFAATVIAVLLVGFSVTVALQARRVAVERDRARREAATAEGVTTFLLDIFQESVPVAGSTVDVRALDVVDHAAERIATDLTDEPIVRARVMSAIGGLYSRFGREEQGRPLLREAVSVLERDKDENAVPWAFAVSELATLDIRDGYTQEEVDALREVVDVYRTEFGDGSLEVIAAKTQLATSMLWTGDFAGARAIHDEAIGAFEALEPESSMDWLSLVNSITTVIGARGDLDRALKILQTAYPLAKEAGHIPILYGITGQLAEIYGAKDDVAKLDRYAHEQLDYAQRTFGPDNWQCQPAWRLVGDAEHAKGNYDEAEAAYQRMLELEHEDAALGQNAANLLSVAELLIDDGRAGAAVDMAERSVSVLTGLFGYDTSLTAQARLQRARAWVDLGNTVAADTTLRALDAYHERTRRGPRGHAEALEALGRLRLGEGEADSAVVALERAVDILEKRSPGFWKLARMRGAYGRALIAAGDREAAKRVLEDAHRVLDGRGDRYEREVDDALASLTAGSR